MKSRFSIIDRPHLTEKVVLMKELENKVVFQVDRRANKIEIKDAIESIFSVKVEKISTINCKGKVKRLGKFEGRCADWKKAIVTLKEGEKIEYFEGA